LDIIMWNILSRKFCINMCTIINHYTTISILMYVHNCNQKFYSMCGYHTV
jgi:hypothetical protein